MNKLTFVVPAYGESPYLRECLNSLISQTIQTDIVIATSTPNKFIDTLAEEFASPIRFNAKGGSISLDWNFALNSGNSDLVVLAHQDDLYHPEFAGKCLSFFDRNPDCAFAFTDSAELIEGRLYKNHTRELVKKILRKSSFLGKDVISNSSQYRRLLGFGSPIPCPAVAYNRRVIKNFAFSDQYSLNLDWDAWSRLAVAGYKIGYIRGQLMTHRVHAESETQRGLADKRREREDYLLFSRYWPAPLASALLSIYRLGY